MQREGEPYKRLQQLLLVAGVIALLVLAVTCSFVFGVRATPIGAVWDALFEPVADNADHVVVRDLRLSRTVIGILAGSALGVSGALIQGVSRNPIADPGLLGINSGASLAVVIAIAIFDLYSATQFVWFAFIGAAAAAALVFAIGSAQPVRLALVGAAVMALLTPITTLVLLSNTRVFAEFRFWVIGALAGRDAGASWKLWPFLVVGVVLAIAVAPRLNMLALGDDVARGLGQNPNVTRAATGIAIVMLSGTATALAGPVALVGLVVPHVARRMFGADYRWIVIMSLALGPTMLLAADVVGRIVVRPGELEAGVVAALIGAPVLVAVARAGTVEGV